ncbi:MAG TPA: hypothetical protein VGG20_25475 [Thermoanaerobaculia bacterium]
MAVGYPDDYHPSPEELERFLLGEVSSRQAGPIIAHLMRGCDRCQARMQPTSAVMFGLGRSATEPAGEAGSEYDFPLFKALATARRFAAAQAKTAGPAGIAPALRAAPLPAAQAANAAAAWSRCQKLIDTCRELRYGDPETLLLTAGLAVAMAERLDPHFRGAAALADLQAYALAELGNARRINDDFPGAEADLARGMTQAAQGTGSPLLLAHLMDLTASLYIDRSRFEDARVLVDAVEAIHQREGDRHSKGRALISKGFMAANALEDEEGVRFLSQGLTMIDANRDPKLAMSGIFNLIWSLVECRQAPLAETLFNHSRPLFSVQFERKEGIKYTWLEGRIAAALDHGALAEQRFRDARASFEEFRLPAYVALVSLDMASLWLRAGRTSEIMALVEETIAIFQAQGMSRAAITTLLVLREAVRKQQVTEALLHATAVELSRLKNPANRRDRVLG